MINIIDRQDYIEIKYSFHYNNETWCSKRGIKSRKWNCFSQYEKDDFIIKIINNSKEKLPH